MGYKRKIKTVTLKFTDPDFDGFECVVGSLPLKDYLKMADLAETVDEGTESANKMLRMFAKALRSWNLEEEDGEPIPPTYDGLISLEFDFVMAVIAAWMEAVAGVDDGLGKDSPSGGTFPEGSLPMEPLSPSLAS